MKRLVFVLLIGLTASWGCDWAQDGYWDHYATRMDLFWLFVAIAVFK